jgi:hypothetical protein
MTIEVLSPLQSIAAQAFATNELMLCPSLHRFFADEASLAIESPMTASGAERLPGILDGGFKLGAALGVPQTPVWWFN